jgi:hypothetical protein
VVFLVGTRENSTMDLRVMGIICTVLIAVFVISIIVAQGRRYGLL